MNLRLTHYTRDATVIQNILSNGFAWVPNRRNLISKFVPNHDFSEREPQQFGMISFTEQDPEAAFEHRKEFGNYGVVVSEIWARTRGAQKVLYIDREGPLFGALAGIFEDGYNDVKSRIRFPDDAAWQMAYTNKAMAGTVAGSRLWASLLQLYEYVEPIENAYQQEWRIVHPDPYYGYADTKAEIIRNVSPPQGWAKVLNVLTVTPQDILGFACPCGEEGQFQSMLPEDYRDKVVETFQA